MHVSLLLGLGEVLLPSARPLGSDSTVNLPRRCLPQCANDAGWFQFQESPLQAKGSQQSLTQQSILVTLWYTSSDIVPVTISSVVEDVVPTTDFITTTEATAIRTSMDVVTTTATDNTSASTVANTDGITTTDATIYATQTATQTATLSMTITDATVTNTATSFHTVTTAASLVQKRYVEIEEDDQEEFDSCPARETECTSSDCLYSSWLDEVSTIATSLSSACSCLVVPATTKSAVVITESQATRTIAPSIFVTATSRVTSVQSRASSQVVSATTVIQKTSRTSLFVTQTLTSATTKYVYATASSFAIVTRVATDDETASTTTTFIESVTIDETASATIHETASTTISTTETTTTTISPTPSAQLPNPYHDTSTGRTYELECGYEYSYSSSKIVGIKGHVTFLECLTACSASFTCAYGQYESAAEECWLLSAISGGQAESAIDVAYVVSP